MNDDPVDRLACALLYEGYLLYPYRPSAIKNRQRFNFGVLYPEGCCRSGDRGHLQVECPVQGTPETRLSISLRFLQLVERVVPGPAVSTRQEAIERQVATGPLTLGDLQAVVRHVPFECAGDEISGELAPASTGREPVIAGAIEVRSAPAGDDVHVLTIRVTNLTEPGRPDLDRDAALLRSLVSAHVVIEVDGGALVSLLDTPEQLRAVTARCANVGVWPVLVGEPGSHDRMLASPIILYDYPQIAAESTGDLFDSTEIDEILALRILTLTEDEKREVREGDMRARQILDRTEGLPPEHWARLHGAVRGLRRVTGGAR